MSSPPLTLADFVQRERTALVVLDLQNDFCVDERRRAMLPIARRVIDAARETGMLIVYVQNAVLEGGASDAVADQVRRQRLGLKATATIVGTQGHRIHDSVTPRPSEPIVQKLRSSAFLNTTLETILDSSRIETLVLVGTATQGSVLSTAISAIARNYYVVVVRDAVESFRADLHAAAMLLLEGSVHEVTDSNSLIALWRAKS